MRLDSDDDFMETDEKKEPEVSGTLFQRFVLQPGPEKPSSKKPAGRRAALAQALARGGGNVRYTFHLLPFVL